VASTTAPRWLDRSTNFLWFLAILEFTWLAWFLIEPMPNVPREWGVMRRGFLLLKGFPELVPGTSFRESLIGQALLELSHPENLPERIPIVAAACLLLAAAIGLGELMLKGFKIPIRDRLSPLERIAIDYGVGTAGLGVLILIAGRLGWLNPWLFRVGLGTVALLGLYVSNAWKSPRIRLDSAWVPAIAIVSPFVLVMMLGAMLPSVDFDVLEYHLQGPKEYFLAGKIAYLPHNVYTNMPFGVEMLHLAGMEILDDWWWGGLAGQLMVAFYAPAAAILIAGATRAVGSPAAARFAFIVYLTTPWIYRLAVIAYVEGPLCYYHSALILTALLDWRPPEPPRASWWLLIGLLSGGAMACKYPALISAVIPFGLVALAASWNARSARIVGCYILSWSIIMTPWLVKNVIDHGNPVYPLGYAVFGGPHWTPERELQWVRAHGPRPASLEAFWLSIVDVAGRSDWQSPLYVAFAPLALLCTKSRKAVLAISAYAAYLFLTWWVLTHRLDRFWLPILPALAILAGLGADWSDRRLWRIIRAGILIIAVACNFLDSSTALTGLNEWTRSLKELRTDLPARLNPPLAAIDRELPPNAKILLVGQAAVFHVNHPVLYNTVFNPETIELMASGKSAGEFHDALKAREITHIYVDWKEVRRHRDPAGYGFTDFVTPERFAGWIQAGVLQGPTPIGAEQELYLVK
jgi:hypothetical protein